MRSKVLGSIFEQRLVNWTGLATKFDTHTNPLSSTQVSADIEGMFLQVGVIPKHQPSLCFLWREEKELPTLSKIQIPRSYFEEQVESLELHMFGDSSQDVFSAVVFLRGKVSTATGYTTELVFVFEKARVAPMKALTIPKLELQASLLAARLRKEIESALTVRVDNTFMWTDSTTVLQWLHSLEKQPVFVTNRVAEILELTTVDEWNYVKSSDNPADAGTREVSANSLRDSPWLKGPSFL